MRADPRALRSTNFLAETRRTHHDPWRWSRLRQSVGHLAVMTCGGEVPARTGRVGAGLAEGGKFDVAGRRRATGPVVALAPGHRGSGSRAGGVHDQPGVVAVREEEPVRRLL